MGIKSLLSTSIFSKAFEFNSELAWKPEDVADLALELKEKQIAVLGGEVWERKDNAPNIGSKIYHWSSSEKKNDESWSDYVERTLVELKKFVGSLPQEKVSDKNTYINIEMTRQ